MGKGTTTSEFVARKGCERELQFVLKSQSEICGGESLGRTRASTRRMTTTMSSLPKELVVAEILSRVPMSSLGSVRSTCKLWNFLSKNQIFGKVAKNQVLGFMMKGYRICSVRIDLQRICDDFIDLSIKPVSFLNQIKVYKVYHCDGLLLCIPTDTSRLLVWNPYLGQTRWIPHLFDSHDGFSLGYDNNGNYKILQILDFHSETNPFYGFKIYELSSNSWRDLDVTPNCDIRSWWYFGVTLKGNVYFYAQNMEGAAPIEHFLLCFDFTSERFGPRLSLPFRYESDTVILSRVRDKQLAVLNKRWMSPMTMEIWVTDKIDYSEVLWTKWMKVDMTHYPNQGMLFTPSMFGSFFIDEDNKVAVVFDLCWKDKYHDVYERNYYQSVLIIGQQDEYFKSIYVRGSQLKGESSMISPFCPSYYFPSLSSYVPSLMQIA